MGRMSVGRDVIANVNNTNIENVKCGTCKFYTRRDSVSIVGCSFWDSTNNSKNDFCSFWDDYKKESEGNG
jgi:hypothetical protein